jgi:ABC-type arginine/histidine transport system permease subunit
MSRHKYALPRMLLLLLLLLLSSSSLLLVITFVQGIYIHIPETNNHVYRVYIVAAILYLHICYM